MARTVRIFKARVPQRVWKGNEPAAQAVRRNLARFPEDFMFQLDWKELQQPAAPRSRSQIVILKRGGNVKHLPYAFTEQGVAMLSSVLRSSRAVEVNIAIMRAFVQLRQWTLSHADLARRLAGLEKKYDVKLGNVDGQLRIVFEALQELMEPSPTPPRPAIGFGKRR
jgi:hypothetical protein